ncbi:MAG TPA: universal stress protein, partial [Blastocatellia bacterium]|nr:universal stress protein [Blastocatellia bacterium]
LGQEFQSEMDLMYVLRYATIKGIGPIKKDEPQITTLASRLANAVPAGAADWCQINQVFAEGDAGKEILRYAETHPIDLICMGAIASESLMYKVLGSTANRVLRGAPCPVLISRPSRAQAVSATNTVGHQA